MHEMALAQDILDIIKQHIPDGIEKDAPVVECVRVVVGQYSGVETECLKFAFDTLKTDTACAVAKMEISVPSPTSICSECKTVSPGYPLENCPHCGHDKLKIETGMEFQVQSFELIDTRTN